MPNKYTINLVTDDSDYKAGQDAAKDIILKAQGGFKTFWKTLPKNQQDSTDFNVRRYWELHNKPKDFQEAVDKGMYTLENDGYHANSIVYNQETGEYEFMKSPNHPTVQLELDCYNSPEMKSFRQSYKLDTTITPWKYVPRYKRLVKSLQHYE